MNKKKIAHTNEKKYFFNEFCLISRRFLAENMYKVFSKPFIKDIILAVSGSSASMHAAKFAIMLAKNFKCRIQAVYVADTASLDCLIAEKIFVETESKEWEVELENHGRRCLAFTKELARAKGVRISAELRKGKVSEELVKAAKEKKAQMIVICGVDIDKCSDCVVAQNREEIQRNAKCSVLLVNDENIDTIYRGRNEKNRA
ncbi:MAG: hypothetical protein Ta2B_06590 [Termitinemataceae bacterium]|nr:MAG: hypothetical protein Ta2B_06590 [Termitinemataceae bacterium]